MSFSFNFLAKEDDDKIIMRNEEEVEEEESRREVEEQSWSIPRGTAATTAAAGEPASSNATTTSFRWLSNEEIHWNVAIQEYQQILTASEVISLAVTAAAAAAADVDVNNNNIPLADPKNNAPATSSVSSSFVRRIQEDAAASIFQTSTSTTTNIPQQFLCTTDLVPGVYEGGLKVWECSVDLCRHLYQQYLEEDGSSSVLAAAAGPDPQQQRGRQYILELGCGHGLPSCWILKQQLLLLLQNDNNDNNIREFSIVFSDYNEFVLRDVTLRNVILNACDALTETSASSASAMHSISDKLSQWLSTHIVFGAGDWNQMSSQLLLKSDDPSPNFPEATAIPDDGLFDIILAAETTYSEQAAIETAQLIVRHLRPHTGVAYVATKRYYFGVRGGTSCLMDAMTKLQQEEETPKRPLLDVQVLQVYDNGAGNIRELLRIQDSHKQERSLTELSEYNNLQT